MFRASSLQFRSFNGLQAWLYPGEEESSHGRELCGDKGKHRKRAIGDQPHKEVGAQLSCLGVSQAAQDCVFLHFDKNLKNTCAQYGKDDSKSPRDHPWRLKRI